MRIHLKGHEVAAVNSDDDCTRCYSPQSFLGTMYLDQVLHALCMGDFEQVPQLSVIENGADQQNGIRTPCSCLVNLVFVYNEILAQHRKGDRLLDRSKMLRCAEKEMWLGQY